MTTPLSPIESLTPSSAVPGILLQTEKWFDAHHQREQEAPIDEFLDNLYSINKLYLQAELRNEYSAMLGSVVYLGMVSAAESFFRSLLRRLILIDDICKVNAAGRSVSYGAAVHHELDLLPEALLEGISLASSKNIQSELRALCGLMNEGNIPPHLEQLFVNFDVICQIRHCGIHRFGKLGSQQALRLGIDKHQPVLEKPLNLTVPQLQDTAEALEALVRSVNSYCFSEIIKRTHSLGPAGKQVKPSYAWSWQRDFAEDRQRFALYYEIFRSKKLPDSSPSIEDTYASFVGFVREFDSSPKQRGMKANKKPPAVKLPTPSAAPASPETHKPLARPMPPAMHASPNAILSQSGQTLGRIIYRFIIKFLKV